MATVFERALCDDLFITVPLFIVVAVVKNLQVLNIADNTAVRVVTAAYA